MTPSARLAAVLELLESIDATPKPADALTSAYFRARRFIGSKDRAYIATTLYDILRHRARLDWWLDQAQSRLRDDDKVSGAQSSRAKTNTPRLRLLAYLALIDGKKLKLIGELFSGGKFAAAALVEEERMVLRQLDGHTAEHPDMPDDVRGECPPWATVGLKKHFGKMFSKEMRAMLTPAPLDVRVNILKTDRDTALAAIRAANMKAEPCKISPFGIRIAERPSLNNLPLLKDGAIEIQDEGSQMVGFMADARPGMRVVDFCAGAGGKTLAMAAMMKNKGKIYACDVLAGRLKRSTERFRRAGVHNIEVKALSSESDPWVKRHKSDFDRVLVDAPCSGTGTWRRNPDARWKQLGPDLTELLKLQANILASASRLVKSGGRLIYATCSLLPEENEQQIEAFLAAHADFTLVPAATVLAGFADVAFKPSGSYLTLTPAQHDTDGFFAAVMERQPKTIIKNDDA